MSRATWERLLGLGFIAVLIIIKTGSILETDVFWQVREGGELLDGAALERADTWSWDPPPGVFMPNSPAWALLVGAAWRLGGSWALWLATSAYVMACMLVLVGVARWLGARWIPLTLAIVIYIGLLDALDLATIVHRLGRPAHGGVVVRGLVWSCLVEAPRAAGHGDPRGGRLRLRVRGQLVAASGPPWPPWLPSPGW